MTNHTDANSELPPIEGLTALQKKVVRAVLKHPDLVSDADLAKEVGEKYTSVSGVVQSLKTKGILREGKVVNFAKLGYGFCYRVDVMINPVEVQFKRDPATGMPKENPQKKLARDIVERANSAPFKDWVVIEDIMILLGNPADLSIMVRVPSHEDIFEFVTMGLRTCPGVMNTSTSYVSWSIMHEERESKPSVESHKASPQPATTQP
jgi:DNA-binding Lrp family transcriptional regulator